ncbi:MAG: TolC family protein [Bacteroidales bacterium]|nr:TolC family protein [Bacteroidales bacterium]
MKRILIISLLFASINAFGQESGKKIYNLQECLRVGIQESYSLKIVKNKQTVSENNATIGNAGFLPTLGVDARYSGSTENSETKIRNTGESVREDGIFNQNINAGLNLNWTIFEGFNVTTNYKKLKELQSQGELQTRIAIENLIAEIAAEYYNYIQQKIRLSNLNYAVELSRERLRIVEQRYRIGNFSGLDYQQAKVDFNADSSALMKQSQTLQTSAIKLNNLLNNSDLTAEILVADTSIFVNKTLVLKDLHDLVFSNNASLLYAKRESHIAELDYKITTSAAYPYLRLNAGYGYTLNKYNKGSNYHRGTLGADFGVTLGINIFDGNNARRERRNAKLNIQNIKLEQTDLEQTLEADLYDIWQAYQNNIGILKLEEENLVTAKLNHEIAMERYMLGDLSGIEMREAQKSLLDAEERLLTATYNTKLCEISLMQISGRINEYLK